MFRFRHSSVVSAFGVLAVALVASAGTLSVPGEPKVGFIATGPAGFKINGKFSGLKGTDDGTNLKLVVPLQRVDTGIGMRDKHCREELFKIPEKGTKTASLTVAKSALTFPEKGKPASGTVTGQVSMNGQTKSVPVTYKARREGGGYEVDGSFVVDMKEFGLTPPEKFGVKVQKDVKIHAKFKIDEK